MIGQWICTDRKILSRVMTICIVEALVFYFLEAMTNAFFLIIGQISRSKGYVPTEIVHMYHKEYSSEISKL